jgi:RNase P subunit RPR2
MGANFGIVGMDWQQRVNWDRLREYRIERARAKFVPVMCADCGLVRYFATSEARDHVRKSSAWKQV